MDGFDAVFKCRRCQVNTKTTVGNDGLVIRSYCTGCYVSTNGDEFSAMEHQLRRYLRGEVSPEAVGIALVDPQSDTPFDDQINQFRHAHPLFYFELKG